MMLQQDNLQENKYINKNDKNHWENMKPLIKSILIMDDLKNLYIFIVYKMGIVNWDQNYYILIRSFHNQLIFIEIHFQKYLII